MKDMNFYIERAYQISTTMDLQILTPKHIIIKLQNMKGSRKAFRMRERGEIRVKYNSLKIRRAAKFSIATMETIK